MPNNDAVFTRAVELQDAGFGSADAVHLAAAEALQADVLLTCDDRLLSRVRRVGLRLRVENPVTWLREQEHAEDT